MTTHIDYYSVFQNLPTPALIISPDLLMIDANRGYERITGRSREDLIGGNILAAFPDNPAEPSSLSSSYLGDSLRRVLETGEPEVLPLQRYDVEAAGSPGMFTERYWCPGQRAAARTRR